MPYRYFRRLDTGELCTGTVGSAGPFVTPMDAHRRNWADAHGLPVEQIEGFEVADADDVPDLSAARAPRTAQEQADYLAAQAAEQAQAAFDQLKLVKALAIWTAQRLGVPLATARSEILTIYRGL